MLLDVVAGLQVRPPGCSSAYIGPTNAVTVEADGVLPTLYIAGDRALLSQQAVAVIGSRAASSAGIALAGDVARELVKLGRVVVSGLATGVDTAAHRAAIAIGGRTLAVVGTDLNHAYPPENARLQEHIYREHLLVSPFAPGTELRAFNFPIRNRVVARLSAATVVVEAGEKSGTRHQVRECLTRRRPVLVYRRVATEVVWVRRLCEARRVAVWDDVQELRELLTCSE